MKQQIAGFHSACVVEEIAVGSTRQVSAGKGTPDLTSIINSDCSLKISLRYPPKTVTILNMSSLTVFFKENASLLARRSSGRGRCAEASWTNMAAAQTQQPACSRRLDGQAPTYMLRISVSPIGSSSSAVWKRLWIVFPAWILIENITWCLSGLQRLLFKSINPETARELLNQEIGGTFVSRYFLSKYIEHFSKLQMLPCYC